MNTVDDHGLRAIPGKLNLRGPFQFSRRTTIRLGSRLLLAPLLFFLFRSSVFSLFLSEIPAPAGTLPSAGTVVTVYDGDTIKVRFPNGTEERVRLIGVNAPEVDDPREEASYQAHLAWRFTFFHLHRQKITLTYDQTPRDKHGRILAYVWVNRHTLFNELILREGFAAAFLAFPFRRDYQERFREAQNKARQLGRGLWKEGEPEVIPSSSVASRLGELASVRFICSRVRKSRSFLYLESTDGLFEALIPRERRGRFPPEKTYPGRVLTVTGFLEKFRGRPQILLFFPRQLCGAA